MSGARGLVLKGFGLAHGVLFTAWTSAAATSRSRAEEDAPMDVASIVVTAAFFALSWGFIVLCDRL